MSKQVNRVNNGPKICMETGLPPGKYTDLLLTLLVLVKLTLSNTRSNTQRTIVTMQFCMDFFLGGILNCVIYSLATPFSSDAYQSYNTL